MGWYKEMPGNLFTMADGGAFDVIGHGCNCMCTMRAGIAKQMAMNFRCDDYTLEHPRYKGVFNKMGQIEFKLQYYENNRWTSYPDENGKWATHEMYVVNCYTQF